MLATTNRPTYALTPRCADLADGKTGGATSLYLLGSKFSHRCINPTAVFHGQDGTLAFRALRAAEAGEGLTISYLGPW